MIANKDKKINELDEKLEKVNKKKKKVDLKENDDTTVLMNEFTAEYKEVTTKLASAIYGLEQIKIEASNQNLPDRFFAELALAVSHEMERIQALLETLPDHTAPLDTSWIPTKE